MRLLYIYISQRFKPLQFLVLSFLLLLLVYSPDAKLGEWLKGLVFLFTSIFAFRFLDDAGSVNVDRKTHPERTYLDSKNYNLFLIISTIVIFAYLIFLFLVSWNGLKHIVLLLFLQVILYIIFSKSILAITLIPILKYPVLLSSLVYLPNNFNPEIIASFFIVLCYDLTEELLVNKSSFWRLIVTELVCGLLLFIQLSLLPFIFFLLVPMVCTFIIKFANEKVIHINIAQLYGYRYFHIILIIYYPFMYYISDHFKNLFTFAFIN